MNYNRLQTGRLYKIKEKLKKIDQHHQRAQKRIEYKQNIDKFKKVRNQKLKNRR